jgi:polyhydroxyalkanoate synthesis regulator phasin
MLNDQLSAEEMEGQRLANELTAKLKQLADERVDEAIKNLPLQNSAEQFQQLCNSIESAIKSLKSEPSSAIANMKELESSLETARTATLDTNKAIKELIEIAQAPRQVVYDKFGRIVEIRRKV